MVAYSRLKCMHCHANFGQETKFVDHLVRCHELSLEQQLQSFLDIHHEGIHPTCQCSNECNVKMSWSGWKKGFTSKYARGHNARIDSVYLDATRQKEFISKRIDGLKTGRIVAWNKGLTKDTDERIAKASAAISKSLCDGHASGSIVDWRVNNPDKARQVAEKLSRTKRDQHTKGSLIIWNRGLTKATSEKVADIATKISSRYDLPNAGRRIKLEELQARVSAFSSTFTLVSSLEDYTTRRVARLVFRCNACQTEQAKSLAMLEESPICFTCCPKSSVAEREIFDFVNSLGLETLSGDRSAISPKELDVYVPSRKLAIEYNGLYWHSAATHSDPEKHCLKKLDACTNAGISLFSIYEDEWRDKRELIQCMIRHRLGKTTSRFYARKLQLREVPSPIARKFFDENHLEGYVKSVVVFGLYHEDELLAAMTLRTAFHRQYKDYYEVGRSCCKMDVSISGWLGKLSKHALKYATQFGRLGLITYVDGRVGMGSGYQNAGWQLLKQSTGPRFWWTDFVHRYDRFSVRANSALGVTQKQAAIDAGVVPIWGCSNSLWQYCPAT